MVAGRGLPVAGAGWMSRVRVSMSRVGKIILREIQLRVGRK